MIFALCPLGTNESRKALRDYELTSGFASGNMQTTILLCSLLIIYKGILIAKFYLCVRLALSLALSCGILLQLKHVNTHSRTFRIHTSRSYPTKYTHKGFMKLIFESAMNITGKMKYSCSYAN